MSAPGEVNDQIQRHSRFVRSLASRLSANEATRDDVEQETWLNILEHPPQSVRSLSAWLTRVTQNVALKFSRSAARRRNRENTSARNEVLPSTADILARESVLREVIDAVSSLPEDYRVVILLRFYDALSPREIAAELNVPVTTVQSRLQRALAALRLELDRRYQGDRDVWVSGLAAWTTSTGAGLLPVIVPVVLIALFYFLVRTQGSAEGFHQEVADRLENARDLQLQHPTRRSVGEPGLEIPNAEVSTTPTEPVDPDGLQATGISGQVFLMDHQPVAATVEVYFPNGSQRCAEADQYGRFFLAVDPDVWTASGDICVLVHDKIAHAQMAVIPPVERTTTTFDLNRIVLVPATRPELVARELHVGDEVWLRADDYLRADDELNQRVDVALGVHSVHELLPLLPEGAYVATWVRDGCVLDRQRFVCPLPHQGKVQMDGSGDVPPPFNVVLRGLEHSASNLLIKVHEVEQIGGDLLRFVADPPVRGVMQSSGESLVKLPPFTDAATVEVTGQDHLGNRIHVTCPGVTLRRDREIVLRPPEIQEWRLSGSLMSSAGSETTRVLSLKTGLTHPAVLDFSRRTVRTRSPEADEEYFLRTADGLSGVLSAGKESVCEMRSACWVVIEVHERSGRPLSGVPLEGRPPARRLFPPSRGVTGADGRLRLGPFPPGDVEVAFGSRTKLSTFGLLAGRVHVEPGETPLRLEFESPVSVSVSMQVNEKAGLPAWGEPLILGGVRSPVVADFARGSWTFEVWPDLSRRAFDIIYFATGYEPVHQRVDLSRIEHSFESSLKTRSLPGITAKLENSEPGSRLELEYRALKSSRFVPLGEVKRQRRSVRDVSYESVMPGTYRFVDGLTGRCTEPMEISAGSGMITLPIHFEDVRPLTLSWTLPHGMPGEVRARVNDPAFAADRWFRVPGNRGHLRIYVPRNRPVNMVLSHDLCVAKDGLIRRIDTDTVAVACEFVVENLAGFSLGEDVSSKSPGRMILTPSGGEPIERVVLLDGDTWLFGSFSPGRYDLFLDFPDLAPMSMQNVELSAGLNELDTWPAGPSSEFVVDILARPDGSYPALHVEATSLSSPSYRRVVRTQGESSARLSGLGSGRFRLTVTCVEFAFGYPQYRAELDVPVSATVFVAYP